MWVYYLMLLLPFAFHVFASVNNGGSLKEENKGALLMFFSILTVLLSLRHESVGNDTRNYIRYFEIFSTSSWNQIKDANLEQGFVYFNKLISIVTEQAQFFLTIVAIVTVLLIYRTYRRLCVDSSLTIALFCILSTFVTLFSGIRQMLAVSLGFVAYEFVREKKLVHFLLTALLACTFHTSAFILLVMYPLYHVRITKSWLYVILPSLLVVFVFNKEIFGVLSIFLERYTKYDTTIESTGAYMMIVLFALFSIFAFLIPDEVKLDKETIGLRNFLVLSLAIQLFAPLHTLAMRMNYYFIVFIPLLIPKIIEARSIEWGRVAIFARNLMVAFFTLYFFYSAYSGYGEGNLHVFPYHFFWENV